MFQPLKNQKLSPRSLHSAQPKKIKLISTWDFSSKFAISSKCCSYQQTTMAFPCFQYVLYQCFPYILYKSYEQPNSYLCPNIISVTRNPPQGIACKIKDKDGQSPLISISIKIITIILTTILPIIKIIKIINIFNIIVNDPT